MISIFLMLWMPGCISLAFPEMLTAGTEREGLIRMGITSQKSPG